MIRALSFALVLSCALPAWASDAKLPPWFPTAGVVDDRGTTQYDVLSKVEFTFPAGGDTEQKAFSGKHWKADLFPVGDPKSWTWDGRAIWQKLKPAFEKQGFKVVYQHEDNGGLHATLQKGQGDQATYVSLHLSKDDPQSNGTEIIEVGTATLALDLKPPAAKPESISDQGDFPYLPPPPGATLIRTDHLDHPLDVTTTHDQETQLAGTGVITKSYKMPPGMSERLAGASYAAALQKAGWTVMQKPEGETEGRGRVIAKYQKNGRNLFVNLFATAENLDINVADLGNLKTDFAKSCKVAVYGVNFDFNKATLRPDADPVLNKVLALFKDDPKLTVEIGGHTDNVGKPEYNLELSSKRADAVKAWLVKHGVAANRLTSRGYGETQPVAPNDTDVNKARNRRVELKKPGCQ